MPFFNRFFLSKVVFLGMFFQFPVFAAKYEFAVVGDGGLWSKDTQSVRDSIVRHDVRDLILPGDNMYPAPLFYPSYEEVWTPWVDVGCIFDAVAIGNQHNSYKKEMKFFNMTDEAYVVKHDKFVKFIILNSDNEDTADEQAEFLVESLDKAKEPFVFLVYHHPSYPLSFYHDIDEKKDFHKAIRPLLLKYRSKITALIVGHEHLSLVAHFNDLPVILDGSTHEQREQTALTYTKNGVRVKTEWFDNKAPAWARISLNTVSSVATVDFIRASDDSIICSLSVETGKPAELKPNCL